MRVCLEVILDVAYEVFHFAQVPEPVPGEKHSKELVKSAFCEGSSSGGQSSSDVVSIGPVGVNKADVLLSQSEAEWDWMADFDWEGNLKEWEIGKSEPIKSISALFGKLVNFENLMIN